MPQQLVLIDPEGASPRPETDGRAGTDRRAGTGDDWHLDAQTREIGLRGIAEARRILTEAARRAAIGERSAA